MKEDSNIPEPEAVGEYRVYWGISRFDFDPNIVYSHNDLLEVMKWAQAKPGGFYLLLDAKGIVLSEIS